jgi:hypothetical protein
MSVPLLLERRQCASANQSKPTSPTHRQRQARQRRRGAWRQLTDGSSHNLLRKIDWLVRSQIILTVLLPEALRRLIPGASVVAVRRRCPSSATHPVQQAAPSCLGGSVRIGANVTNFEAYLRALGYARQHYNSATTGLLSILLTPTILARALTEPIRRVGSAARWRSASRAALRADPICR